VTETLAALHVWSWALETVFSIAAVGIWAWVFVRLHGGSR